VNALDKCGLGGGDAISRKRRRYERLGVPAASTSTRLRGNAQRRLANIASRRRAAKMNDWVPTTLHDPLTKLKVFKEMKKAKGKGKASHSRNPSSSSDHSISDVDNGILDSDERMELSDIEWYTRQTFDDEEEEEKINQEKMKQNATEWDEEDDDDLDMSEVELGVMASPMRVSPRPASPVFRVSPMPIYSVAEANHVPACLYRPTADIIEEVYEHLGLDTSDCRSVRILKELLDDKSTGILRPKSSRYEVGSSGIFPNRPVAARDWAALSLTRKIIRRDRLAKSAIYRFTFRHPKELVPGRFLRWQTWNHPTLTQIKQGLRLKLEEREEAIVAQATMIPSSPAAVEEELDDDLEDVDELDEILSVTNELDEEDDLSIADNITIDEGSVIAESAELEDTDTGTEVDDNESLAEDERLFEALGLTNIPEYESPARVALATPRRTPIYSRLPRNNRVVDDEPPLYAPRNYRDQSPTPPPPFNAQTDNDVIIQPHFSPAALAPAVSRLLPAFEMDTMPRRPISPLPSPERRARVSARIQRRVVSGEIVIPGAFAAPARAAAVLSTPVRMADAFELALDMEEAETALDFLESPSPNSPALAVGGDGIIGWGASIVRSWWRR
jgi:hypothetical protein